MLAYLRALHARHAALTEGAVATYIPELATADPAAFAIAVATVDGTVHEVGESRQTFTIQSISKPLTFGLAVERLGAAAVRRRIGVEPTGDAFNGITLHPRDGTPLNPMVNAGAIAAAGLFAGTAGDPIAELLDEFGACAGRALDVDELVYRSERDTGHRNRAIAHLLRSTGALDGDADAALDLYFQQCSVAVDTRDLALVAATLAAGGRNPLTGRRVFSPATTRSVLSVMASCGMYDGAGEWMVSVGLPAKSGVGGGIIAVLPGRLGIGVFSPPLDAHGNSVRGIRVCRDLSAELGLHLVGDSTIGDHPIHGRFVVGEVTSKRRRGAEACARLQDLGDASVVLELRGDLTVLAVDRIAAALPGRAEHVVLDVRRVSAIPESAVRLLAELVAGVRRSGTEVVVTGAGRHQRAVDAIAAHLADDGGDAPGLRRFVDVDRALEWIEDRLLAGPPAASLGEASRSIDLRDHPLLAGLDDAVLETVVPHLEPRRFPAGGAVVDAGDPASELYLVVSGSLSVTIDVDGLTRRLATLGPGGTFGEAALFGQRRRTADVMADDDVECYVLAIDALEQLEATAPAVAAALFRSIAAMTFETTRRLTAELAVLAR